LAGDLARLIDDFHTEGADLADLQSAVPDDVSEYWKETVEFLKIISEQWPRILAEEGGLDPTDRRNRLLTALADRWQKTPPDYPVIAAGSTGSIPATARLLSVIARLPEGAVVLSGLDTEMDAESWEALALTHPQYGLKNLLDAMRVDRREVDIWEARSDAPPPADPARVALLSEAMRPPPTTDRWPAYTPPAAALQGLTRMDLADPAEEAGVIALIMRATLETPERTAALITPDRQLARRVMAELARWDIAVNDSAGTPLAHTPVGSFLTLVAELLLLEDWTPARFLSLMKHPLTALGHSLGNCRRLTRALELAALRGPRPAPGIDGMRRLIGADRQDLHDFLDRLAAAFAPLADLPETADIRAIAEAHIAVAEALAATDAESGAARLWAGEAGEAAALQMEELLETGAGVPLSRAIYPALLRRFMSEAVVRPRYGLHPRLFIWSPMEARLQRADEMILGGLNEGTWPAEAEPNPWLSRPMQRNLGLSPPERDLGLSAHDFVQLAAAPTAYLTRSAKIDGVPTVPLRWLLRLGVLAGPMDTETPWRDWYQALDTPAKTESVPPPRPCPPVAARPERLSVTEVETWMRDPYTLYARKILGLEPLEPIDAPIGARERGTIIHDVLHRFLADAQGPEGWRPDRFIALADAALKDAAVRPLMHVLWAPRFRAMADWIVAELNKAARDGRFPMLTEVKGEWAVDGGGAPFTLVAKADRIDRNADGLVIIDYKTGVRPTNKQIAAGYAPQLPLEALMAETGAFGGLKDPVAGLEYWTIKGLSEPGEIKPVNDLVERVAEAEEGLKTLIARFADPDTPYLSHPRPAEAKGHDFDHLARVPEWRDGGAS